MHPLQPTVTHHTRHPPHHCYVTCTANPTKRI
ncbi:hypothetical protein E2C01_087648 [Portunus trituberculatus]|uniref:Uncharacterized protein n=1 Tax=Portunus trituberculatus TaxID=210409 RepID=A0A5B7JDY0_PORTR|nr:hypothetical protein [Portunus trituberculatus]